MKLSLKQSLFDAYSVNAGSDCVSAVGNFVTYGAILVLLHNGRWVLTVDGCCIV